MLSLPWALISAASGHRDQRPVPAGVGWSLNKQSQTSRDNLHLLHTPGVITNPAVGLGLIDAGQDIKEEPTWRELSENQNIDTGSLVNI